MSIIRKHKFLGSSSNPEKLAMTIQGALLALILLVIYFIAGVGVDITPDSLKELINTGFASVSAVLLFAGLVRKAYHKIKK